jgi:hypothetical protein
MFTEETDDESTDAGFRVIDYLEFTGFDAGIFILSRPDITRSEDSKEELIVSHPQKQKRDTRIWSLQRTRTSRDRVGFGQLKEVKNLLDSRFIIPNADLERFMAESIIFEVQFGCVGLWYLWGRRLETDFITDFRES